MCQNLLLDAIGTMQCGLFSNLFEIMMSMLSTELVQAQAVPYQHPRRCKRQRFQKKQSNFIQRVLQTWFLLFVLLPRRPEASRHFHGLYEWQHATVTKC